MPFVNVIFKSSTAVLEPNFFVSPIVLNSIKTPFSLGSNKNTLHVFHGEYRGEISTLYLKGRSFEAGGYLCPGRSIFDLQVTVVVFAKQLAHI